MEYIAQIFIIAYPAIVIIALTAGRGSDGANYVLPHVLRRGSFSKKQFRQAGISLLLLGLWLPVTALVIMPMLPESPQVSDLGMLAIFLCFFLAGIGMVVSLLIGSYYLGVGILSRKKLIRPSFRSQYDTDPKDLPVYLKRVKRTFVINIGSVLLLLVGLYVSYRLNDREGPLILFNVGLLITFIISMNRLGNNVSDAKAALGIKQRNAFLGFFLGWVSIILTWVDAISLIRRSSEPAIMKAPECKTEQDPVANYKDQSL